MIFNYYYIDLILILRNFFFIFLVLFSLCVYTVLERVLIKKTSVSLFYSVSVYFIFILFFYLISLFFKIDTFYYSFNYSLTNFYGVDFFEILLVIFFIFIFYVGISEKNFRNIKNIPFETSYILSCVFIGIIFLLYSFDFLMIFLSLELQNFSLYVLMNIQRNKKIVVETCIKYYILGVFLQGFYFMVYL